METVLLDAVKNFNAIKIYQKDTLRQLHVGIKIKGVQKIVLDHAHMNVVTILDLVIMMTEMVTEMMMETQMIQMIQIQYHLLLFHQIFVKDY